MWFLAFLTHSLLAVLGNVISSVAAKTQGFSLRVVLPSITDFLLKISQSSRSCGLSQRGHRSAVIFRWGDPAPFGGEELASKSKVVTKLELLGCTIWALFWHCQALLCCKSGRLQIQPHAPQIQSSLRSLQLFRPFVCPLLRFRATLFASLLAISARRSASLEDDSKQPNVRGFSLRSSI